LFPSSWWKRSGIIAKILRVCGEGKEMHLRRGGDLEVWRESRTTESSKESLEWHVGASTMESSELQFLPQKAEGNRDDGLRHPALQKSY